MNINVLIDEVFARPALWNQKQKHHHNTYVLDRLWDEVADKLCTTRFAARNKWKNLRHRFRTTLKTEDPERYTGEWKYFYSLMFLKDQFLPRGPAAEDGYFAGENQEVTGFRISPESSNYDTEFPPLSSSPLPSSSNSERRKRKRSIQIEDEECEQMEEKRPKREDEDEDLNFFKSVLPHIRSLSPYDKMDYRIKIMKLTQEFLTPSQNNCHPTTTGEPNLELPSKVNGNSTTDSTYILTESIKLESPTE
nr:unnamed protein product [Callosobruchus chinensis]